MATKNLVPRATGEGQIGTSAKKWSQANFVTGSFDNLNIIDSSETKTIQEYIEDKVNGLITAGTGISSSYDDSAGTLTIASTVSGGAAALNDLSDVTLSSSASGHIIVRDSDNNSYDNVALSGDATLSSTGVLTISNGAVENAMLDNSSFTLGSTSINLGDTKTTIEGLNELRVNNLRISGNTISSTNTSGNIVLAPNNNGVIQVNNKKITDLAEPTGSNHAATKQYVDNVVQGLDVKNSVRLASTGNIATLSDGCDAGATIDGQSLVAGDRVLLKDQSVGSQNGIYVVAGDGVAPSRASDMAAASSAAGVFVFVEEGTANSDKGFVCTNNDGNDVVNSDDLTFSQFSGAGQIIAGTGLSKTGETINLANTSATPGNYGSATQSVVIQVDAQGRITSVSEVNITGGGSGGGGFTFTPLNGPSSSQAYVAGKDYNISGLSSNLTATLPNSGTDTDQISFKNMDSTYTLTILPASTKEIDGSTSGSVVLDNEDSATLICDGSGNWYIR